MELLKEAKNVVDFATYYPLLNKATIDNDTPTPGYLFEEIIKLSHQSSGHRQHLVDFLLARLQISSWPGKQKVVRVLHQVCSRGHYGVRIYLRGKDGELRKASSSGGPPDPVLANTPQLFLSSAIQELLTLLFDPKLMKEDEQLLAGKGGNTEGSSCQDEHSGIGQGYGSSSVSKGKYEGFGSTPVKQGDNIVNQVRGMVERVMSPSGEYKRGKVDFLQGEKGDYQPLSLPSLGSSISGSIQPTMQPHLPILARSRSTKYKVHKTGKAGGGWDSDDEASETAASSTNSDMDLSLGPSDHQLSESQSSGISEEEFITSFLNLKNSWPPDYDGLLKTSRECTSYNLTVVLEKILSKLTEISEKVSSERGDENLEDEKLNLEPKDGNCHGKKGGDNFNLSSSYSKDSLSLLNLLLLIEFGIQYDIFSPSLINNILGKTFLNLTDNGNLDRSVRSKAKKLMLITIRLT